MVALKVYKFSSPNTWGRTPLLLASIPADIKEREQSELMLLTRPTRVDNVILTQEDFVAQWIEKRPGWRI